MISLASFYSTLGENGASPILSELNKTIRLYSFPSYLAISQNSCAYYAPGLSYSKIYLVYPNAKYKHISMMKLKLDAHSLL